MQRIYKVGTRTSSLALKQVEEVFGMLKKFYPDIGPKVVGIDTYGDKDKVTPVSDIEGTDFFTREIDEALLRNEIDFSVHSAKDLPDELRNGLAIAAITAPLDPFDALVSKSGLVLDKLPKGARIGTSSLRRKTQLKEYREDFEIVDVRGNIEERLMLLDEQRNIDAIVIAACGLVRLGLSHRITQRIPLAILKPHSLQGSLAIAVKKGNTELAELLSLIDFRKEVLS
jgi:hydroxymethylbilane synthase